MKIGVLVKQVPDTESIIRIAADGRSVVLDELRWVMGPYDEIAVEEALRLRECVSGEVVIVTAGPARAVESMRQALALGADRGIRVDTEDLELDPFITAQLLAEGCRPESFDILFAGKVAVDDNAGQVPVGVAELLGWPLVSPIEGFEFLPEARSVRTVRAAGGGIKEIVEAPLPAVIGCEKGLNTPRFATLPNILKAKAKPIAELSGKTLAGDVRAAFVVTGLAMPAERQAGRIIPGDPAAAAEELARLLHDEAKVL